MIGCRRQKTKSGLQCLNCSGLWTSRSFKVQITSSAEFWSNGVTNLLSFQKHLPKNLTPNPLMATRKRPKEVLTLQTGALPVRSPYRTHWHTKQKRHLNKSLVRRHLTPNLRKQFKAHQAYFFVETLSFFFFPSTSLALCSYYVYSAGVEDVYCCTDEINNAAQE